jgi:hypothetical protein
MQYDAGIDVSLEQSSVCVVDAAGKIVKEAKVATDPHVLVTFFKGLGFPVTRIGLEAGPLSQWLYAGLIPFTHHIERTIYGKDVMDLTIFGLRSM